MAYQQVLNPENTVAIARQMEEEGYLSKDLSESEKNSVAYKLMTDQLTQMKRQIAKMKTLLDCSTVKGVQQP